MVTFATIGRHLFLYIIAPKGFLPLQDTASITAVTEAGTDVSFAEMRASRAASRCAIKADPGCDRRRLRDRRGLGQSDARMSATW
jgi:multidrug efflux pump